MLEGDLGDFTLPDILNLLAFTTKSGRLGITTDDARGRVELVGGRVRDASADADRLPLARRLLGRGLIDGRSLQTLLDARNTLPTDLELARELVASDHVASDEVAEVLREQTLDAVFDLRRWTSGTFRFEAHKQDAERHDDGPDVTVEDLLAETERRLASWTDIHARTGDGDAIVTVGRPADAAVEVDADGWQLIGLADGHRTVDDLAVLCGRGQFDTRSTLAALLDLGVVTIGAAGSGGGVEGLLADQVLLTELEVKLGGAVRPSQGRTTTASAPAAPPPASQAGSSDAELHAIAEPPEDERDAELAGAGIGSRTMRSGRRTDRLRQDPTVDADLVSRLIDGVKGM